MLEVMPLCSILVASDNLSNKIIVKFFCEGDTHDCYY